MSVPQHRDVEPAAVHVWADGLDEFMPRIGQHVARRAAVSAATPMCVPC
jgi:hypothetical protein